MVGITIRIPPELYEALWVARDETGVMLSQLIMIAIWRFICKSSCSCQS